MSRNLPAYAREHSRLQVSRGRCVRCKKAAKPAPTQIEMAIQRAEWEGRRGPLPGRPA